MKFYRILLSLLCVLTSTGGICQGKTDSLLDVCLAQIKTEKFDSFSTIKKIPAFIRKQIDHTCRGKFKIASKVIYDRKMRRNPFKDIGRLNFGLMSSRYCLIYYFKNGDLYSTEKLMVYKFDGSAVTKSHILGGLYECKSPAELLTRLNNKWFSISTSCR